jgi:hypothetical protein
MDKKENLKELKRLVSKYSATGQIRKPKLGNVVDPQDILFIRDLKRRGESNTRIAEILHVTDDALKQTLDQMNLV